jgi:hypothetical protein
MGALHRNSVPLSHSQYGERFPLHLLTTMGIGCRISRHYKHQHAWSLSDTELL